MTTEPIAKPAPKAGASEILLDGLFTGMIGALIVAGWFLILDLASGRPLWTPALLGTVLLRGGDPAHMTSIQPLDVAAYTAVHFLLFIAIGVVLSYLATLFERFPIMFFVLTVLFVSLQVGVIVLDQVLRAALLDKLRPWAVIVANLLAAAGMAFYLWRRHPSVLRNMNQIWEANQEPQH
jgi:hypothetical protein